MSSKTGTSCISCSTFNPFRGVSRFLKTLVLRHLCKKKMPRFFFAVLMSAACLSCFPAACRSASGDSLTVLFWNLENFFDTRADSTSLSELEFTPRGARHWGRKRFNAKCNAVAKVLFWSAGEYGALPDVACFAELENKRVLKLLIDNTLLRKTDYVPIHFDSPDPRGIDVGLIYRKGRLVPLEARPIHIYSATGGILPTRDMLHVRFMDLRCGMEFDLAVCHFPSKYGGREESLPRRRLAAERLEGLTDSLFRTGVKRLVVCGDFNDVPVSEAFDGLNGSLDNLALPFHSSGRGTIRYRGRWEMIDFFLTGKGSFSGTEMQILSPPFLSVPDRSGGEKPLRTYAGPRYSGGVSDHRPVFLAVYY